MLSYPIPEAEELLISKLGTAQKSLSNCEEDLDFLREQITVRFPVGSSFPLPPFPNNAVFACSVERRHADHIYSCRTTDHGSRHSARVQLGHRAEEEGEGGRGQLKIPNRENEPASHQRLCGVSIVACSSK